LNQIDPLKKHNLENLVPCCKFCNSSKSDYTYEEFMVWIERVISYKDQRTINFLRPVIWHPVEKSIFDTSTIDFFNKMYNFSTMTTNNDI